MVKEAIIIARVPASLKDAVIMACKKKNLTQTAYVIRSLTHELHGQNGDSAAVHELTDLKAVIDARLSEYDCDTERNTDVLQEEVKDLNYYLKYIRDKQEQHGCVTEPLLKKCAKDVGLTFTELLQEISEDGLELVIM